MDNQAKLNTIIEDALKVIINPAEFYQKMPKSGGYADPVIFVLLMAVIMGLLFSVFSLFGAGVVGAMAAGFGAIFIMPVFAILGSFIGAAILFVIWRLMGSDEPYETAYRCVAYASAIYPAMALLGLIPYLGSIISVAWGMYLMIMASIEVQRMNRNTAYIVFGILGALMIVVNLSSEIATRQIASNAEGLQKQFEVFGKQFEQSDEMTPEEAGEALGKFLKGFEEATKDLREQD